MDPEEPRMVMFREEFCNHAQDLELHLHDIFRHLLPDNVGGLCDAYFESEADAMRYLCAVGIERERVREYLDVAAKMFILCQTYSSVTLTEACQRVAEEAAKNGMDWYHVMGLGALRGVVLSPVPRMESPEGEERTPARPVEPKPAAVPVPQLPECIRHERARVAAVIEREVEARIRSLLLKRTRHNICCNKLGRVETSVTPRNDGSYFAYAEFVCPVCVKVLSSVSEVYWI